MFYKKFSIFVVFSFHIAGCGILQQSYFLPDHPEYSKNRSEQTTAPDSVTEDRTSENRLALSREDLHILISRRNDLSINKQKIEVSYESEDAGTQDMLEARRELVKHKPE